jgi:hypothetical protein
MILEQPLLVLDAEVGPPVSAGLIDGLETRLVPINGGTVSGRYSGSILPGGADWQTVLPSGDLEIRAHYLLHLDDGLVEVRSEGVRCGSPETLSRLARGEAMPRDEYYFRTFVRLRTASAALAELNTRLWISVGERLADRVRLEIHEVA